MRDARHENVLTVLKELGGQATSSEIAKKLGWTFTQITNLIIHMEEIQCLDKNAKIKIWQIKPKIVKHACYGEETLFDITQKEYVGSSSGYLELLIINDPPTGKSQYVVHEAVNYGLEGRFAHLNNYADADIIYKLARSCLYPNWRQLPEVTQSFIYKENETPWFYSKTKEFSETTFVVPD